MSIRKDTTNRGNMGKASDIRIKIIQQQAFQDKYEGLTQRLALKDYLTRKLLSKDRLFEGERSVSQLDTDCKPFDVDLELDSHRDRQADQLKSYDKFIIKSVPLNEKESHQPLLQMKLEVERDPGDTVSSKRGVKSNSRVDS